jgi:hypothetical protein
MCRAVHGVHRRRHVVEGDAGTTEAVFSVARVSPSGSAIGEVRILDFDATAPGDYSPLDTTVSFAEGETTKTVTVTVNGDTEVEPDERYLLGLCNPWASRSPRASAGHHRRRRSRRRTDHDHKQHHDKQHHDNDGPSGNGGGLR